MSVPMPRLRRSLTIGRTDRSTHVMPAVPKDRYLPNSTTYFLPHVPQADNGAKGLDSNDATGGASADEREGSRGTTTYPHRKDADDRLYSTVARQSARGGRGGRGGRSARPPRQPGRVSGRHFGGRGAPACTQELSQSAQRGGIENFR